MFDNMRACDGRGGEEGFCRLICTLVALKDIL